MQTLVKQIQEHALEHGSIPFWSWNDKLEPEELKRQIHRMHELGMKGFFMHARGGLETEYLSEEWYNAIRVCVEEAKALGMEAWCYDENGWPSGFAGGELLKDKANWATYLKYEHRSAFPEEENVLGVYVISDGVCRRVLKAEDGVPEYVVILQAWDESYVDTMDARITQKFIQATHEEYKRRIGFSDAMPGFFTDEPQYYRWATPWSDTFLEAFPARYGYDVCDGLAALFEDYDGAEEFRWDYYRLCHESFINGFIRPIYEWCEQNGCRLTGHAVEESTLAGQMWCCGGIMPFYAYEHIPGIDYLSRNIDTDIAPKQLDSACAQLGKRQTISEMYGGAGWDVTPIELKRIAELQYVNGVNTMCQHLYPYSERGERKNDWPCHYSEHLAWQSVMGPFNQYFNHLGYLLSLGEEQVRTLVIHPIHSAYLTYKRKEDAASVKELQDDLYALNAYLSGNQIPYHFGDECMMADMAQVEETRLRVGRCAYDTVVVPAMDSLDSSTANLLKDYLAVGGRLCLFGKAPTRIDGRKADLSWLKPNMNLKDLLETADVSIRQNAAPVKQLRIMERKTETGRILFIANISGDTLKNVEITVKDCPGLCELNLNTLAYHMLPTRRTENRSCVLTLDFEDSASYVLIEAEGDVKPCSATARFVKRERIPLTESFRLTEPAQNTYALDMASISYDGTDYGPIEPVIAIRDLLLRKRYRGPLWMKFAFTVREIPESVSLAVEPLSYTSIQVNGTQVSLDGEPWFDRSFKSQQITPLLRKGENEIVLAFDYFQRDYVYYVLYGGVSESLRNCLNFDTEIERIYLFGEFCVDTDPTRWTAEENNAWCYDGSFVLAPQRGRIDVENVVRDGYPFFAGAIGVETEYNYTPGGAAELVLEGRYAVIDVCVNGKPAGQLMFGHHMDIRRFLNEGKNTISLKIYNSNRNLLGPHHLKVAEPLGIGPSSFTLEGQWTDEGCPEYRQRYAFVRFGIDVGE